jgi:hypothetical protein
MTNKPIRTTGYLLALLLGLLFLLAACSSSTPTPPPLPTPVVPDPAVVASAINLWESGDNQRYFLEVEESSDAGDFFYRIVIAEGEVRAAQRLQRVGGEWSAPEAFPLEAAEQYTVDAILERIRKDTLGEGPAPMDLFVVFDPISGYPTVIQAKALPSRNSAGQVVLNREYSYDMAVNLGVLIEDTIGLGRERLMTLNRSGGPAARCDTLRIFTDGTSVYSDDCRQILLQLSPPAGSFEDLQAFAGSVVALDEPREVEGETHWLVLNGTGSAEAAPETREAIWSLADELGNLLSKPIGAGVTLIFQQGNLLVGFDMRSMLAQPASLEAEIPLYGSLVNDSGNQIAFADSVGFHIYDNQTGDTSLLFVNRADEHFIPWGWTGSGQVIAARVNAAGETTEVGWASIEESSWHPLTAPEEGWGCAMGISASQVSPQFAISARTAAGCQGAPALQVANLEADTITPILTGDSGENLAGSAETPAWSPDGEWIAVVLDETADPGSALYLVRPDGTELTRVPASGSGPVKGVAWSSDSRTVFYGQSSGEDAGIYAYDRQDDSHTLLIPGTDLQPLSVSPGTEFMVFRDLDGIDVWVFSFNQVFPVSRDREDSRPEVSGWLDLRADR